MCAQGAAAVSRTRVVHTAMALEGALRSLSSLPERLHHSYVMYVQPTPHTFVTVEAYIAPPALLLVALALWAAHIVLRRPPATSSSSKHTGRARPALRWPWQRQTASCAPRLVPATAEPLCLAVDANSLLRATGRVVGVHLCACVVGAVVSSATRQDTSFGTAGEESTGSRAALLRTCSQLLATAGLFAAVAPKALLPQRRATRKSASDESASGAAHAGKAVVLVATTILFAGWLFVNWCALSNRRSHAHCRETMPPAAMNMSSADGRGRAGSRGAP